MSDRILRKQLALLAKVTKASVPADPKHQSKAQRERQRVKRQRVLSSKDLSPDQVKKRNLDYFRDTMAKPSADNQ